MAIRSVQCITCGCQTSNPAYVEEAESGTRWPGPYCSSCAHSKEEQLRRDYNRLNETHDEDKRRALEELKEREREYIQKWKRYP